MYQEKNNCKLRMGCEGSTIHRAKFSTNTSSAACPKPNAKGKLLIKLRLKLNFYLYDSFSFVCSSKVWPAFISFVVAHVVARFYCCSNLSCSISISSSSSSNSSCTIRSSLWTQTGRRAALWSRRVHFKLLEWYLMVAISRLRLLGSPQMPLKPQADSQADFIILIAISKLSFINFKLSVLQLVQHDWPIENFAGIRSVCLIRFICSICRNTCTSSPAHCSFVAILLYAT